MKEIRKSHEAITACTSVWELEPSFLRDVCLIILQHKENVIRENKG